MPCLYILYSEKTRRYYIGSTDSFARRFAEHQRGQTTSTKNGRPWIQVFTHETIDIKTAQRLEKKLKNWKSRSVIENIVKEQRVTTDV